MLKYNTKDDKANYQLSGCPSVELQQQHQRGVTISSFLTSAPPPLPVVTAQPRTYSCEIKGGEANFSFRDFKPDFLNQYLLKHKK